jgi:predicted Zn-dependent protease
MSTAAVEKLESVFQELADSVIGELKAGEHGTLEFSGERSQFIRLNHARVRHAGRVEDAEVKLTLIHNSRTAFASFPFQGELDADRETVMENLRWLRNEVGQLPEDPYAVLPENKGNSREEHSGELPDPETVVEHLIPPADGADFTGIYAAGTVFRANANSAGQKHWFSTETFTLDYSLIAPDDKAVKETFAGTRWDQNEYESQMARSKEQLRRLALAPRKVERGKYRTYFAPAAVAELVRMLSWGGLSEASLRQGESALGKLRNGEKKLSSLFHLKENFKTGLVPRFNEIGEVAPEELVLISNGELVNTLVSSRTAKEYGLTANGAGGGEGLRMPEMGTGTLRTDDVLKTLNRGLYLSNLHYLNWSDRPGGRVTGMTRFACFWVEDGEIQSPIENLRFDESLYHYFGDGLVALTETRQLIPEVSTYGGRQLGGEVTPGMLVDAFTFTL